MLIMQEEWGKYKKLGTVLRIIKKKGNKLIKWKKNEHGNISNSNVEIEK